MTASKIPNIAIRICGAVQVGAVAGTLRIQSAQALVFMTFAGVRSTLAV